MRHPQNVLKQIFGYDEFRDMQEDVVEHILSGQDCLTIMPTGGGKSICFQVPALILPHLTIVISPLISLMKDQVDSLRANGVKAAFYNSTVTESAKMEIFQQAKNGSLKLLYLSPEVFVGGINWITELEISLIAIDEAHCVSMWGHDFRPEYQEIGKLRQHFNAPFAAFTATADKVTRQDIKNQLGMPEAQEFLASFNRPNLSLSVQSQVAKKQKQKQIISFIENRLDQAGIIYCLSRKETEEWSSFLCSNGFHAKHYHAGLTNAQREEVQNAFILDECQIICATIAFGMGIDKPNVRWVIHNNLPKNMEGYYQEIGRAGRDGLDADTVLYYNYRDVVLLNNFVEESDFKEVYHEKINRMLKYAEATTCRRKILLAYFGEESSDQCGNCDICLNPPQFIDGTIIAQKALSAVIRSGQSLGINNLTNVLRGAKTAEVFSNNWHQIKTYGAGSEFSFKQWQHYINQLINQGALEISYTDKLKLRITELGNNILRGKTSFQLTDFEEKELKKKSSDSTTRKSSGSLQTELKSWRLNMAKKNKVPAYVIFNDATLEQLIQKQPKDLQGLEQIQGLGKVKIDRFGEELLQLIQKLAKSKKTTQEHTLELYQKGLAPQEIAKQRELSEATIYGHLIQLFEQGQQIDIEQFITEYQLQLVKAELEKGDVGLKEIYEGLNGQISYDQIKICIALIQNRAVNL